MKPATPKRASPRRRATGKAAAARAASVKTKAADTVAKTKRESEPERARTAPETAMQEAAASGERELSRAVSTAPRAVGEAAGLTKAALDAWAESGSIVARGMEDIGAAWLRYTQRSVEDSVEAARALLSARSLREAVEVQSDYARNSLGSLMSESVRLSELSVKVAQEAMQPLKTRLDAAAARMA